MRTIYFGLLPDFPLPEDEDRHENDFDFGLLFQYRSVMNILSWVYRGVLRTIIPKLYIPLPIFVQWNS